MGIYQMCLPYVGRSCGWHEAEGLQQAKVSERNGQPGVQVSENSESMSFKIH